MKERLTIIQGDALTELKKLPDASVQCCITSPPSKGRVVQRFTPKIKSIAISQNGFIHQSSGGASAPSGTRVKFAFTQRNQKLGVGFFDDEKRQKCGDNFEGEQVRSLPAKQRPSCRTQVVRFSVVRTTKGLSEQSKRTFVNHPHLNSFVVKNIDGVLVVSAFDADITFTVNQSSQVGECRLFHADNITQPHMLWQRKKGGKV